MPCGVESCGMPDEFEQQEWVKLGVAAALSRQYAADQRTFLANLAEMLQSAMPGEVQLSQRGGLFSKKTVQAISLPLGDDRYTLEDTGRGPLRATRVHVVRGIALKTDEIPVDQWLTEIGAGLDALAQRSAAARAALERVVG
jgi:hypothetical protein